MLLIASISSLVSSLSTSKLISILSGVIDFGIIAENENKTLYQHYLEVANKSNIIYITKIHELINQKNSILQTWKIIKSLTKYQYALWFW